MRIGFTGTQKGMTVEQENTLRKLLWHFKSRGSGRVSNDEFHSGDCIGADAQAHKIAESMAYRTIGHPPDNVNKRAFLEYSFENDPLPYLIRNDAIVAAVEILIAAPYDQFERARSGTWATIRTAMRMPVPRDVFLINPDGGIYIK